MLKQIKKDNEFFSNVEYTVMEEAAVVDCNYKIYLKSQDKITLDEVSNLIEISSDGNIEVKYQRP
jgi:hypothetical protein